MTYLEFGNNCFLNQSEHLKMASTLARAYEVELLSFLKLFKRQELLGFSYEKKKGKWSLFLHFANGVVQITGEKQLKNTIYASLVTETVPWNQ